MSPREWYIREGLHFGPHLKRIDAEAMVEEIFSLANVVSSDRDNVKESAILRRL